MKKAFRTAVDICLLVLLSFSVFILPPLGKAIAFAQELAKASLTIKGYKLNIEVAETSVQRSCGLMYRKKLDADSGMLFVYEKPQSLRFWMKDTLIPLSIAFLDAKGVILDIQDMKPKDLTTIASKKDAVYALEVNKGWFKANKIKEGDRVEGLEKLVKK